MNGTKQKVFIIIVLLLVVLFGVGQFFAGGLNPAPSASQTANSNGQPTQVIALQNPFTITTSTPVETGSCWTNSIAAPYRSDAWRCMVGNAISDPCFSLAGFKEVACGSNPLDASSTFIINLTKPLPNVQEPSGPAPSNWAWLVMFADGTVCSPFTGTRPFDAAGDVATYSCNGGVASGETMIFGTMDNSSTVWTAEIGSLSTATSTFPPALVSSATVPVFAVWQ